MTKHRKCTLCDGRRKILEERPDSNSRRGVSMVEIVCPRCNGKGYEEKENNDDDHVRVLGR